MKSFSRHILISILFMGCLSLTIEAQTINSLEDIEINGLEQRILIQSEDTTKPVLLFLHAGPGMTSMMTSHYYNDSLIKNFIYVDWDQRGAGFSYNDSIDVNTMTIDQFVLDVKVLTEYLLERFNQEKIFLIGHSWGSLIGIKAVAKYPEYFHSYIGIGQAINLKKSEELCYEWLHGELTKANDTLGLKLIEETHFADRNLLGKYGGIFYSDFDMNKTMGSAPYFSQEYIQLYQKGLQFSIGLLFGSQVMNVNLFIDENKYEIPLYFMQGKYDRIFGQELLTEFIEVIEAPKKEIIWFENSGRFPQFDGQDTFQRSHQGAYQR